MTQIAALPERAVIAVTGEDRAAFLQGLVSNDVANALPGQAVWAALLTPQGKWLADFFILSDGERLLMDCERAQSAMLRLALVSHFDNRFPSLLAAQATASPARVAVFDRPPDPTQLWRESSVEAIPPIRKPEALAAADLNGDSLTDLIIGENNGDGSRLLVYWGLAGGKYQGTRIDATHGLIAVWPFDYDQDGRMDLIGLGPSTLYLWRNQALQTKK